MGAWRNLLDRLQDKIGNIPNLTASPQPFSAAMLPETLMVPGGQQAFCVEIPSTSDVGERQRALTSDGHTVAVSGCSAINVAGSWATSLGLVLDTEQSIREAVLNRRDFSPYRVRWGACSRTLTPDRAHIVSTLAFTVDHESDVTT